MAVATVTLVPIRLVLMLICLIVAYLLAGLALTGISDEQLKAEPISGWRKMVVPLCNHLGRGLFFFGSFLSVDIKGSPAPCHIAPVWVIAPHSSFIDVILMPLYSYPSIIGKSTVRDMPLFGKLAKLAQPIFVYREDKDSRQHTIAELKRRAHSNGKWQQFLIFPEGTTTNRKALITFKPGGFIPGKPVQPVLLRYPDEWDSVTWTWEGPSAAMLVWMCLCKLYTKIEIEFLPVYVPSEEEIKDPYLYAENVRRLMGEQLGIPTTDHTFDDCRLMQYAVKANLKMGDALIEFRNIQKRLGLNYETVSALLDKFCVLAKHSEDGGRVTIDTFSQYMGLPITNTLREMFNLFDRDRSGHIDFREYVIGMSLIAEPATEDATVRLAFKLFDKEDKGYVTEEEFTELLNDTLDCSKEEAVTLFRKVDKDSTGHLTYGDFKLYAEFMPEYAGLFTTYHQLKEQTAEVMSADILDDELHTAGQDTGAPTTPVKATAIKTTPVKADTLQYGKTTTNNPSVKVKSE